MNQMFMIMMIMGTMITINSSNWMGMWMGLEINFMSFIPLISKSNNMKSSQSSIIYFLAQSIGSMVMIFSVMVNPFVLVSPSFMNDFIKTVLTTALLLKLGAAPMHKWFPEMMNYMYWSEMFLLMTWQKLAPLFILSMMTINSYMMYLSIMLSAMLGAIGGMNTTSLRKIMAYSSINHLSWMIMLLMMQSLWSKYLMVYSMMLSLMCLFFSYYNSFNMNQMISKTSSFLEKYTYSSMLLSMGGLPPFLGFLPKWMTMQAMINSKFIWLMMFMLMMSMITLFYYLRLISSMLMIYSTSNKWVSSKNFNNKMMIIMYVNLLLPLMLMTSFY